MAWRLAGCPRCGTGATVWDREDRQWCCVICGWREPVTDVLPLIAERETPSHGYPRSRGKRLD